MSEPKAYLCVQAREIEYKIFNCYKQTLASKNAPEASMAEVYLKSEVEEYIAKLKDNVISMIHDQNNCRGLDTQSVIGEIANVMFKHWNDVEHTRSNNAQLRKDKANLLHSNECLRDNLKSEKLKNIISKVSHEKELRSLKKSLWLTKAARFQSAFYHFDLEKDFWADRGNAEKENHFYEKREQCLRLQNACLERAKRFE